jgi:CHRD domain
MPVLQGRKVALAALVSVSLTGAANPSLRDEQTLTIPLNGQDELNVAHPSGGTGDLDGSGVVKLTISPEKRNVCYDIEVDGVAAPMLAYIHEGPVKRNGPPVVGLLYSVGSDLSGCVPANAGRLSDILSNPTLYYVSIATTEFPDGALRGQVSRA